MICGAVPASLLVKDVPPMLSETTIGTSPAPASVSGSVKSICSQPGMSGLGLIDVAVMMVVPTVIVTNDASPTMRDPLRLSCRMVGTSVPVTSGDVTLNGSSRQGNAVIFVTLQTNARPPSPIVDVKISGWACISCNRPRITVPLLFTTTSMGV